MNRLPKFLLGGLLAFGALTAAPAQAQTVVINHPTWGPEAPASAQYYYLPEVGGYYDLRSRQYIIRRDGQWQRRSQLNGYNPNSWRPQVIDYVGDQPWGRHDEYRRRYPANLPPGQRKRLENGKGLPPGQAKKYDGRRSDGRRTDDRRTDDRRTDGRRNNDDYRYEERRNPYYENGRDDDRGKKDKGDKNKGKGKGKD